jgi:hypothetical protein
VRGNQVSTAAARSGVGYTDEIDDCCGLIVDLLNNRIVIRRISAAALAIVVAAAAPGCRREPVAAANSEPKMIWRTLGAWSGHGNRQTESFTSDSGALRVKWETMSTGTSAAAGAFRLTAHSAISGRVLQQVIEAQGTASGVDYVSQDPHVFYMSVESAGIDWKFSVEEGIAAEVVGGSR